MDRDHSSSPLLLPFGFFTLVLFYFVWGALHDLAHGDEGTLEWTALACCAVAFPILYWLAIRNLTAAARLAWLVGTGILISLFSAGAFSAMLNPKYPRDPMLGRVFLAAGLPMLGVIAYRVARDLIRKDCVL